MVEPKWLTIQLVLAIHSQAVAEFGGSHGVRDTGLLESALDRPRNLYVYGDDPNLFDFAAVYCMGIVKNHPFIDGNKRTGDLTARAFLFRNGYPFEPDVADEVNMIVALAAGEIDEGALARWISENSTPKPK